MGEVFLCVAILNLYKILTYFNMNQVNSAVRSNLSRRFALALFLLPHNPSVILSANVAASWLPYSTVTDFSPLCERSTLQQQSSTKIPLWSKILSLYPSHITGAFTWNLWLCLCIILISARENSKTQI